MRRTYHQFPQKPELERRYNFRDNLPYIVKVIAGMDGQSGTFITDAPDLKGLIKAKRSIGVEIADRSVNFYPLNKDTFEHVLQNIDIEGTIDFRVNLKYSFLDEKYDRVPFMGDSYLVRTELENGILTVKVHHIEGMGRTECTRIADTIVDEIIRNTPNV
ncbi:hypothetical protein ANME2D_02703 [Candidatus Methanoperedens nitroreducens]|uniref:Uncharacterized protein n=1 Tax=Candidatus Methanoperedens nitratireducens TaxID=1392998 RepID=A0A062V5J5_9EURY|nr:hypothetical protein [Candidatus Methanoperedens nitroreducens]KCZ70680.1 hypothetical protein ANME2D_02703 [Candidatus Methanoperedens nitroreducens]MDJ1420533.1 hypothetical protein [Candidatus Methanoperedens sp.]